MTDFESNTTTPLSWYQKITNFFFHNVFPIRRQEMVKFFLYVTLFLFVLLQYTVLRTMKDSIVQAYLDTASSPIPALKIIVPIFAVISTVFCSFLVRKVGQKAMFYIMATFFTSFLALYGFYFFPYMETLVIPFNKDAWWPFLHTPLELLSKWFHVLYYVNAELFGVIMVALCWNFANQTITKEEAKRYYSVIPIFIQIAVYASGELIIFIGKDAKVGAVAKMATMTWMAIVTGIIITIVYFILNKYYVTTVEASTKKKSEGLKESLKALFSSREIFMVCCMILSYCICMNALEVQFKQTLKEWKSATIIVAEGSNLRDELQWAQNLFFAEMLKKQAIFTGILGILSGVLFRNLGWLTVSMITPITLIIGGFVFLGITAGLGAKTIKGLVIKHQFNGLSPDNITLNNAVNGLVVKIGAGMIIFARQAKYTLFDTSKEMVVRLMPPLKQYDCKAAESLSSRVGKLLGSLGRELVGGSSVGLLVLLTFQAVLFMAVNFIVSLIFFNNEKNSERTQ